jgi:transposase-like protein
MPRNKVNLAAPMFHDDVAAREHLESILWPFGPTCPRCGVGEERITKLAGKSTRPGVYKCKDCRKPFSVTVGTVMERSHIALHKWVLAAQLMASSKKGFSAHELHRLLGTNYETAWFLFHRLREASKDIAGSGPLGGEGRVVEADEAYFGGKESNKHAWKRAYVGGGKGDKAAVFALVDRDGRTKSFHVANVTAATLRPLLVRYTLNGTHLITDEAKVYVSIGRSRTLFSGHTSSNHRAGEYVTDGGFTHTNSVESHFALLKRAVTGTFHHISEAHLPMYLAEFDFRASTRDLTDAERAGLLLAGTKGKRLLYRQPA